MCRLRSSNFWFSTMSRGRQMRPASVKMRISRSLMSRTIDTWTMHTNCTFANFNRFCGRIFYHWPKKPVITLNIISSAKFSVPPDMCRYVKMPHLSVNLELHSAHALPLALSSTTPGHIPLLPFSISSLHLFTHRAWNFQYIQQPLQFNCGFKMEKNPCIYQLVFSN